MYVIMNRKNLIGTGAAARIAGAARHLIVKTAGMLLIAGAILTLSACKEKSFFETFGFGNRLGANGA